MKLFRTGKGKGKGKHGFVLLPCRDHTSKALRYGTRSQGIWQFYLHIPRSSANGMNHTCLCRDVIQDCRSYLGTDLPICSIKRKQHSPLHGLSICPKLSHLATDAGSRQHPTISTSSRNFLRPGLIVEERARRAPRRGGAGYSADH